MRIDPKSLGLAVAHAKDLKGGDATQNAAILRHVLAGQPGPQRDIVLLNAAASLWVVGAATDLEDGIAKAAASIDDGAATAKLEALAAATSRAAGVH